MTICTRWYLPYHAYRIIHHKLLSQIVSVTTRLCPHQILLQHLIHHLLTQAVRHHLIAIKPLLKRVQIFNGWPKHTENGDLRLILAITNLIISEGLSFNLALKPRFKKVLDLEINVPKGYQPPSRNLIYQKIFWM